MKKIFLLFLSLMMVFIVSVSYADIPKKLYQSDMDLLYPYLKESCFSIKEIKTGYLFEICGNVYYNPSTGMILLEIISDQTGQVELYTFPLKEYEMYNELGRMVPDKDGYLEIIPYKQ